MNAITDVAENTSLVNFIQRASLDPAIDVVKLEALLRMQHDVLAQQARREFNRAMSEAQGEMQPVLRDAVNSHVGNRYARLETIDRDMRPIYTKHGFSVRYGSETPPRDGWIRIRCTVAHAGGFSEDNYLEAQLDMAGSRGTTNKPPIQAVGSSVTYLRRYLLTMVFNIVLADEDDDGEATRKRPAAERRAEPTRQPTYEPDPPNPWETPEYHFATGMGGRVYHTGSEWLERWRRLCEAVRLTNAPDKLQRAAEMNAEQIKLVGEFDPQAAQEVREMLEAELAPRTPAPEPLEFEQEMAAAEAEMRLP